MAITSTSTGVRWIGNALDTLGREYLEKMADQEVSVQDMAPAALIGLIGSGEVPMSPTIFDANVAIAKQKGSPVEWRPLEPVVTTVGSSALMAKAPHPYTALLFIDFLLSKEGQQLIIKGRPGRLAKTSAPWNRNSKKPTSTRSTHQEELEAKFTQWETLLRQLFIRKR